MISRARKITALLIVPVLLLQACGLGGNGNTSDSAANPPTPGGPGGVGIVTTDTPDVEAAAKAYLDAWANFDYKTMYGLLASLSQDAISFDAFETRYQDVAREASIASIEYDILQSLKNPSSAQAAYRITLNSALVGPISRETRMSFSLENGAWRVIWDDSIILPELAGGNLLSMQVFTPTRGIIYDHNGDPLSAYTDAVALSVIPSNIDEDSANGLVAQLSTLTGIPSGYLSEKIFADDAPFLTPIAVLPADVFEARSSFLEPYLNMLSWTDYFTRLSYNGNAGANTIGYVSSIPAEEVDAWAQLGYPVDAIVGRDGLEGWGEEYLAGKRGGELYVVSPDRQTRITILNSREAQPSDSIYSTLDSKLQFYAQLALGDFTGSVIVMERDTGRILAMASSPTYDPNDADFSNPNSVWGSYFDGSTDRPFLNRATQGQYPPGSIFKLITMAAALESGLYSPQSTFYCGQTWDKIGTPLENWTVEKGLPADGELSLQEGLMRSCNPWFYEIGWTLYGSGGFSVIADMARAFGLGSPTGLQELPEAAGQITNPDQSTTGSDPVFNAVQQAIGQSDTQITPLQALVYVAAVGNGGNVLQPQLTERIEDTGGTVIQSFAPIITSTLPVSEDTLFAIQAAMRMVVNSPRGTAYRTFANMTTPIYGKTGTAQNPGELAHAWFIGYTNAGRTDLPDIAIVVMLENIGDGSEFAAPIFRRMVEVYFTGIPQRRYPWELQIGVIDQEYFSPPEEEGDGEGNTVELTPSP